MNVIAGGHATLIGDLDDQTGDGDYIVCDFPNGVPTIICDKWGCYLEPERTEADGGTGIERFDNEFEATQVYNVEASQFSAKEGVVGLEDDFAEVAAIKCADSPIKLPGCIDPPTSDLFISVDDPGTSIVTYSR